MNNNNIDKIFMAFGKSTESTDSSIKRYIGIAPVFVTAVNPTKKELEKIYNTEIDNEPNYLSETEVGTDEHKHTVPQIRIEFIVQTDAAHCDNINMKSKVVFFLNKEFRYTKDGSKVEVINKYGETTWIPVENLNTHTIPENLSWFEPADFRPAFIGERELTLFLKNYLGIPNKSFRKKTGEVVELKNKADAEVRLDKINDYFTGDISELKSALALQPNNRVKCMFGVRTTEDNKQYQTVFNQMFLKNNVNNYAGFTRELQSRREYGAYSNVEFDTCPLKEYTIVPTDFNKETSENTVDDLPFGDNASPWS